MSETHQYPSTLNLVSMALPITYIDSQPGVGKYTIAREFEKKMKGEVRVISLIYFYWVGGGIVGVSFVARIDLKDIQARILEMQRRRKALKKPGGRIFMKG